MTCGSTALFRFRFRVQVWHNNGRYVKCSRLIVVVGYLYCILTTPIIYIFITFNIINIIRSHYIPDSIQYEWETKYNNNRYLTKSTCCFENIDFYDYTKYSTKKNIDYVVFTIMLCTVQLPLTSVLITLILYSL